MAIDARGPRAALPLVWLISRRGGAALATSIALASAVAGCGSDDAPAAGGGAEADAGDASADVAPADDASDATSEGDAAPADPLSWPVDARGPYSPAYHVGHVTYQPTGGLASRTIEVHYWYPTSEPNAVRPKYLNAFSDPESSVDAPPAASAYTGGYPVLVHSHGYKGFAGNSATLFRYLATHGWVVVAPEHLGNTLLDTPAALPLAVSLQRPLDMRAALDHALSPSSGDPLEGKLDAAKIAVSGHSFGTYTVWALAGAKLDTTAIRGFCAESPARYPDCDEALLAAFDADLTEPRAKAFVPMAGGESDFFGPSGYGATVRGPVLLMTGTVDRGTNDRPFSDASGFDFTWVDVEGGCHQLFGLGNNSLPDAACKALPDAEGFAIVDTWLLAYLRAKVLGDTTPQVTGIVDGSISVSSRVTRRHKP